MKSPGPSAREPDSQRLHTKTEPVASGATLTPNPPGRSTDKNARRRPIVDDLSTASRLLAQRKYPAKARFRLPSSPSLSQQYRPPSSITQSAGGPSDVRNQSALQKTPLLEAQAPAIDKVCDAGEGAVTDSEIPGISAHYKALIAAARSSLAPAAAQALVRRLRNEKILATRAAKDRRRTRRLNRSRPQKSPIPLTSRPYPKIQFE